LARKFNTADYWLTLQRNADRKVARKLRDEESDR
jgi:hypothetical protein